MLLEEFKAKFEEKLQEAIQKSDLNDEKMKLTTVDTGRFSGSLEKGVDYYT